MQSYYLVWSHVHLIVFKSHIIANYIRLQTQPIFVLMDTIAQELLPLYSHLYLKDTIAGYFT